ncbi:hypothetical protein [Streptomyces sp. SLBN-115]|uniref:hypothetical protein n=1 Tax=Streptomyces sp. SLBN-115 TaxID=2768453 RepID=UPI001F1D8774|nr:hypothetical protein [Streptomyces sp. SLBN-115]
MHFAVAPRGCGLLALHTPVVCRAHDAATASVAAATGVSSAPATTTAVTTPFNLASMKAPTLSFKPEDAIIRLLAAAVRRVTAPVTRL